MKYFLQTKLILSFFLVVLLVGIAAIMISVIIVRSWTDRQARETIQSDLAAAFNIYNNKLEEIQTVLEFTALRPRTIRDALIERDKDTLLLKLEEVRLLSGLDILAITDEKGDVFVRSHNPSEFGDRVRDDALVARVFETGKPVNGNSIVSRQELNKEELGLADRASVMMEKISEGEENNLAGLFIRAAAPVISEEGNIIGVLYGGILL